MRDILAESGPYRHGFSYCELPYIARTFLIWTLSDWIAKTCVIAGSYSVVASTFEPDLLGQFILTVASNIQVHTEPIPSEGAVSFLYNGS